MAAKSANTCTFLASLQQVLASIPAMAAMFFLPQYIGIEGVWAGLAVLMSGRALLGVGRWANSQPPAKNNPAFLVPCIRCWTVSIPYLHQW